MQVDTVFRVFSAISEVGPQSSCRGTQAVYETHNSFAGYLFLGIPHLGHRTRRGSIARHFLREPILRSEGGKRGRSRYRLCRLNHAIK